MYKKSVVWIYAFAICLIYGPAIWATDGNKITIDINKLDYKKPENNKGDAGNIIFPKVRLTWDDLNLYLDNEHNFLDATIKVNPNKIKFKTTGVSIILPIDEKSSFFNIEDMKLKDSVFALNPEYLNFNGEDFSVRYGKSRLSLDKFNLYCDSTKNIDMTSLKGLQQGCLTSMILNGKDSVDTPGAKIEYYDSTESGKDLILKTTLKDFKLNKDVKSGKMNFKLNLIKGHLAVDNYDINMSDSIISCLKDPKTVSFSDEDQLNLKNTCINDLSIGETKVKVKNLENESLMYLTLDDLKTAPEQFNLNLKRVIYDDTKSGTFVNNIKIDCFRDTNFEFYDLHKILAGCVDRADITIDSVGKGNTEENRSLFSSLADWFEDDDGDDIKFLKNIKIKANDSKLEMNMVIKKGIIPRFRLRLNADLIHDPLAKTLTLKITDFRAAKGITLNWFTKFLLKIPKLFPAKTESAVSFKYPYIKIQL